MSSLYVGDVAELLNRKCPICNSDVAKRMCHISYVLQDGNDLPRQYDVVCCACCGLAYADVDASQEVYNAYYADHNVYAEDAHLKYHNDIIGEEIERKDFRQNEPIFRLIQKVAPHDAAILDIGCGGGELLHVLKEAGYQNICGMDPSIASILKLRRDGIDGVVGNAFDDELALCIQKFDLVISSGVVEHIYDLRGYLQHIKRYLRRDSYVIICVPTIEKIRFSWPLAHYFNHEHINYFSRATLDNLLRKEGFITKMETEMVCCEEMDENVALGCYVQASEDQLQDLEFDSQSFEVIKTGLLHYEETNTAGKVNSLIEAKQDIVIWGAGTYAMKLLSDYPGLLHLVKYFVDNNSLKHGETICGKRIMPVEKLAGEEEHIIILICSIKNVCDIREQIASMKFVSENKVISI